LKGARSEQIPPRERILAAAADLFYRQGIRAVGVDAIAEAADTNKMTLYRHFSSKDDLVAEYLRQMAKQANECWEKYQRRQPGNALAQLRLWLKDMADHAADRHERGCPVANAAIELAEKDHPVRPVIETLKNDYCRRLVELCRSAGLREPELLADELHLMLEGARVTAQSLGSKGLGPRVMRMGEALIAAHAAA
jgi:AcrR family transcriptional regulator